MSLHIKPIQPNIGAIIENLDLNRADERLAAQIQAALLKYQVIFFRNQQLGAQAQVKLAKAFGTLHIHPIYPVLDDAPEVIVLDSRRQDLRDNELWHTDVTFSQAPPLGCVLQAVKIPEFGGDTLWASGTAAFRALPAELRNKLRGQASAARRDYIRLLVDRVEVGHREIRISGSKAALSRAAIGTPPHLVPKAERKWCTRNDSNVRPSDS